MSAAAPGTHRPLLPATRTAPLRVLLADDHAVVRQGLRTLLEQAGIAVIGEAADGHQAVAAVRELRPEVAVFDLSMPRLNGLDAAHEARRASPRTHFVLLTMHAEEPYVLAALRAGIHGYVLKQNTAAELIRAIEETSRGKTFVSPEVSGAVLRQWLAGGQAPQPLLTRRERQVLQLVVEGKTSKEIAALLGISAKTADSHRGRIMDKLDIHDVAGLVRYAIRAGLIEA